MRRLASLVLTLLTMVSAQQVAAREVVEASAPKQVSVTIYRDPERGEGDAMDAEFPRGFAMISETRRVRLPAGESTIRFTGVAEGMVAVTAIVTGLPGGTIEKNRNADLLSPAALVNGMLGNRVRITRFNPGTGKSEAEDAIVRTRADGGIVLQTAGGYEAVQCSGLPEGLSFNRVPGGLSAQPIFTLDTRSPRGGTYEVTLTYLAWGFDWQAHYVATFNESNARGDVKLHLLSWLTLLNDNGQSFEDAELMAVAGRLSVVSDYEGLAEPPKGEPLRLSCFPIGSTAAGSPVPYYAPTELGGAQMKFSEMEDGQIVVTARRLPPNPMMVALPAPAMMAMEAVEEQLGDLKLYRVPEQVTVNAKGLKQVAFLNRQDVEGKLIYYGRCAARQSQPLFTRENWPTSPSTLSFETVNEEEKGLGVALPTGGITFFEPSPRGGQLLAEDWMRDFAKGQDVDIDLADSNMVLFACGRETAAGSYLKPGEWYNAGVRVTNVRNEPVVFRIVLDPESRWEMRRDGERLPVKNGKYYAEIEVPGGETRETRWQEMVRP